MRTQGDATRTLSAIFALLFVFYFFAFTISGLHSWFSDDDFMNLHYYWSKPRLELVRANLLFLSGEPRPLGGLYYVAMHSLWGMNPLPYRIGALALILANVGWLFLLVRELSGSAEDACVALVVTGMNASFASLYLDTGMIYDVLAFFFYYAALYYYLRLRRRPEIPLRSIVIFLALLIAALNSKEISVSLPVALLLYELLWKTRSERVWRIVIASGVVTLLFIVGVIVGDGSSMRTEAYRVHPSLALYLVRSAHYLRLLSLDVLRPAPSGMAAILLGVLLAAWLMRKKHLLFAALMILVSILPLAFIPIRNGFAYYVPSLYWSLWFAGIVTALRRKILRRLTTWPEPMNLVSQTVVVLILAGAAGIANERNFRPVLPIYRRMYDENQRRNREVHQALPHIPPGSTVFIRNDPWDSLPFQAAMFVRLSYDDPTLNAYTTRTAKLIGADPAKADFVLDYVDGHFR